jgi:hypothetical protein|tara:strand:- start:6 stop:146 length:141 start_codon:yes stop_codon:yes gene_type:complete
VIADRMTEDADWRDGMSQFRLRILEEIQLINEKLEQLEQQIKEKTP